jgi:hypothetical protein
LIKELISKKAKEIFKRNKRELWIRTGVIAIGFIETPEPKIFVDLEKEIPEFPKEIESFSFDRRERDKDRN